MKDCKFLKPFEAEIQNLFPDHKVEWYRDDSNTEYEEIRIDNKTVMCTDVGEFTDYHDILGNGGGEKIFHHSIVVHFPFINDDYEFMGLSIKDPYKHKIEPIKFELFCEHKILRMFFPFLMETNDEVIKKVFANLCDISELQKDF